MRIIGIIIIISYQLQIFPKFNIYWNYNKIVIIVLLSCKTSHPWKLIRNWPNWIEKNTIQLNSTGTQLDILLEHRFQHNWRDFKRTQVHHRLYESMNSQNLEHAEAGYNLENTLFKNTFWKIYFGKIKAWKLLQRGRRGLKYARRKILVHTNKEDSGRAPDPRRVWIVGMYACIHTSPIQSFQSVCEILTFLNYFFDPCSRGRVCWKRELQKRENFLLQSFFRHASVSSTYPCKLVSP